MTAIATVASLLAMDLLARANYCQENQIPLPVGDDDLEILQTKCPFPSLKHKEAQGYHATRLFAIDGGLGIADQVFEVDRSYSVQDFVAEVKVGRSYGVTAAAGPMGMLITEYVSDDATETDDEDVEEALPSDLEMLEELLFGDDDSFDEDEDDDSFDDELLDEALLDAADDEL